MKILVTGGAGYIGSCVVEELLKNKHDVRVLDNFLWGKHSLEHLKKKIEIIYGDLRNLELLSYSLKDIDKVIHLAGIVGDPACKINPVANYTTNIESTKILLNCMMNPYLNEVRDIIFASSCSVYGNVKGIYESVDENSFTGPLSLYAQSKLLAENIIFEKAKIEQRFHPTICRITTLFGWSPRPRFDLVTNLFTLNALHKKDIILNGDGKQFRSLIHVRDVAKALVKLIDAPRYLIDRKIFHIGDERNNMTMLEIAKLVKKILPKTKIVLRKDFPTDNRDYKINCSKIRNVLNWERSYTVEQGIEDIVNNLRSKKLLFDPKIHRNDKFDYS